MTQIPERFDCTVDGLRRLWDGEVGRAIEAVAFQPEK